MKSCGAMGWTVELSLIIVWFLMVQGIGGAESDLLSPDLAPTDYDIKNNFCRLAAHSSEDIYSPLLLMCDISLTGIGNLRSTSRWESDDYNRWRNGKVQRC